MILLVKKQDPDQPLWQRVARWLHPPLPEATDFGWGEAFLLESGRLSRKCRKALSGKRLWIVAQEGAVLPAEPSSHLPELSADDGLFRPLQQLLKLLPGSAAGRKICLADRKGEWLHWLPQLLPHAGRIELICHDRAKADAWAQHLREEYGAVLTVQERMRAGEGLLLDPAGWLAPWNGFFGAVFCCKTVSGSWSFLPCSTMADLPVGFDPRLLLAAFWQEGRGTLPHTLQFQAQKDGACLSVADAAEEIGRRMADFSNVHKRF